MLQETPPSIDDMLSWTTLTPHYKEDVIYALNRASVARQFNMSPESVEVGGSAVPGPRLGDPCLPCPPLLQRQQVLSFPCASLCRLTHLLPPFPGRLLQGMSDLVSDVSRQDGVTVSQWLRSAYPNDWDHLMERLKPRMNGLDPK
jgi:hypothetical protein